MKILKLLFPFILFSVSAQNTINPNTGDAYLLFGPNSGWGEYFQVGGNGRATTHAGIFATNGNLHIDSKNGHFQTYINRYSQGNTLINSQGGSVGIGISNPVKPLHIASSSEHHQIRLQGQGDKHAWIQFYPSGTNTINWQIGANGNGFSIYDVTSSSYKFTITNSGKVGIGTIIPDARLTVKGNIHAEEIKVDLAVPAPDYVFKDGYDLKSLEEVQNHIKKHGHLPNIPSAKEFEANGIQLGEMDMKLLEKIEELTLYILSQEKKLLLKDEQIAALYHLVDHQDERLEKLENLLKVNEP